MNELLTPLLILMVAAYKILVVDDDAFNIFAMQTRLIQMGYSLLTAHNGKEAIEILKSDHLSVKLIFMYLNMPILSGQAATIQLKTLMANGKISAIPIIACTAYAQENEKEMCLKNGFDDFLTKPVESEELKRVLKKWFC